MADSKRPDPLAAVENPVKVDAEIAAAIERGLREASEGRVVSSDEVWKQVLQWISKFSTPQTL